MERIFQPTITIDGRRNPIDRPMNGIRGRLLGQAFVVSATIRKRFQAPAGVSKTVGGTDTITVRQPGR